MLNCIALQGRLVADPEPRQTPQGISLCRFTVACDRSYAKSGTERQTDFIDIVAWRNTADFVCKYFHKGDMVVVDGRLQTNTYQDKETGKNRKAYEIQANNINFCGGRNGSVSGSPASGSSAPAAHPASPEAPVAYSSGNADDFSIIDDSTDLPF